MKKISRLKQWFVAGAAALLLLGFWAPQMVYAQVVPAAGDLSLTINSFTTGQLQAAVDTALLGGQQYSDITTLTLEGSANAMDDTDCQFIRTEMAGTLQVLDMQTVGFTASKIPDDAFTGCTGLQTVTLPNTASQMGNDVFSGCTSLGSITIPDNLSDVGNRAFAGCTALTRAVMGTNTSIIGVSAFSGCTSLSEIVLGANTTSVNRLCF